MNTARAFGPAVVTGFPYETQWVVRTIFSKLRVSSHIGLVLGWSVPGLVPWGGVLFDS